MVGGDMASYGSRPGVGKTATMTCPKGYMREDAGGDARDDGGVCRSSVEMEAMMAIES